MEVSVLCPTYNRQFMIPAVVEQYKSQTFPATNMELIILDDSPVEMDFKKEKSITYIYHATRLPLGQKRNMLLARAKGDIIVWFDDDDIYHKDRISRTVKILKYRNDVEVIGVKSTVFYDVNKKKVTKVKHRSSNYTCNNILAHRKSINTRYRDADFICEERIFTDDFKRRAYLFEGLDLCIHLCHSQNTAGKAKLFSFGDHQSDLTIRKIRQNYDWQIVKKFIALLQDKKHRIMRNVFWINIAKDVNRRTFMETQFANLDANIRDIRVEALTPNTLGRDGYVCQAKSEDLSSFEEICCMSSHVDVMKFATQNCKNDWVLIMEDDMVLKNDSFEKLEEIISTAPEGWEILQLHHIRLDCKRRPVEYPTNGPWVQWRKGYYSTGCYAITRNAMCKLASMFVNTDGKFDYTSLEVPIQSDNVIYAKCITYTSVHNFVNTSPKFSSNIQPSSRYADVKKTVKDFESKLDAKFPLNKILKST